MAPDEFAAAVEEERAANDRKRLTFQLVYNERCAPVAEWFGARAERRRHPAGRPLPHGRASRAPPDAEPGPIIARNTLVSAVKE